MIRSRAFAVTLGLLVLLSTAAAFAQTNRAHGSIYYSPSGHRIGWAKSLPDDTSADDIANSMCEGGAFDAADQRAMRNGQAGSASNGAGPPIDTLLSDCDRVIRFDSQSNQGCGGFGISGDGRVSDGRRGRTRGVIESDLSSWPTKFIICNDEPASTGLERFANALNGLVTALGGNPTPAPRPAPTIAVAPAPVATIALAPAPAAVAQAPVYVPPPTPAPAPFGGTAFGGGPAGANPFGATPAPVPFGSNPFGSTPPFAPTAARATGVTLSIHAGGTANVFVRCLSEASWHHFTLTGQSLGTYDGATWGVPCQQYAVVALQTLRGAAAPAGALLSSGGPYVLTGDEGKQTLSIQPTPSLVLFNDTLQKASYLWSCPTVSGAKTGSIDPRLKSTFNVGCPNGSFAFGVGGQTYTIGDGQIGHIVNDPSGNGMRITIDPPQRGDTPEPAALAVAQLLAALQPLALQFPQTASTQPNPLGQQPQQPNPFGQPQQPTFNSQPQQPVFNPQPQQPAFNPQSLDALAPLIARFAPLSACPETDGFVDKANRLLALANTGSVGWHFELVDALSDLGEKIGPCARRVVGNSTVLNAPGEQIVRAELLLSYATAFHCVEAFKLTQDQRFITVFVPAAHSAIVWRRTIANADRNPDDLRVAALVQERITDYAFKYAPNRVGEIGLP